MNERDILRHPLQQSRRFPRPAPCARPGTVLGLALLSGPNPPGATSEQDRQRRFGHKGQTVLTRKDRCSMPDQRNARDWHRRGNLRRRRTKRAPGQVTHVNLLIPARNGVGPSDGGRLSHIAPRLPKLYTIPKFCQAPHLFSVAQFSRNILLLIVLSNPRHVLFGALMDTWNIGHQRAQSMPSCCCQFLDSIFNPPPTVEQPFTEQEHARTQRVMQWYQRATDSRTKPSWCR